MNRKILRVIFHVVKYFIGLFVYIDRGLYMKMYISFLKNNGVKINGTPRFIAKSVKFDDFDIITLGDRLVISSNVIFLTHDYSYTTGLISINNKPATDIGIIRPIYIGNNVFIGMNSIILPGTSIGDNVIIGAGSVVRGKISTNSVISGNPAKVVSIIQDHINRVLAKNYDLRIDKN